MLAFPLQSTGRSRSRGSDASFIRKWRLWHHDRHVSSLRGRLFSVHLLIVLDSHGWWTLSRLLGNAINIRRRNHNCKPQHELQRVSIGLVSLGLTTHIRRCSEIKENKARQRAQDHANTNRKVFRDVVGVEDHEGR